MRTNRWMMVGVYVAATAVLAAGVAVLVHDRTGSDAQSASASELPALAPMPFPSALSVAGPASGSVGTQFAVSTTSYSEDAVARVELYDGARLVSSATPAAGTATTSLTYPALSVGPHALHAEVTDAKGRVSRSPATVLDVAAAPPPGAVVKVDEQGRPDAPPQPVEEDAPPVIVPVTVEEGESPSAVAKRLGIEAAQVSVSLERPDGLLDPAALTPDERIPQNAQVVVSVARDAGRKALEGTGVVVANPAVDTKAIMGLSGKSDGCDVVLTSAGGSGKVFYFDGNAGVPGWAGVGETDSDGDLRVATPTPGVHVYFARTDKATTSTVSVTVPLTCGGDLGWTGNARIVQGDLYLPPSAIGKVYLYLQIDGKTGVRIPEDKGLQGRALFAGYVTSIKDLLPDLGPLAGTSAELTVWRAGEFPVEVAEGSLAVPEGRTLLEIVGEPGAIDLSSSIPKSANPLSTPTGVSLRNQDEELTFDWQAASDRVDEVLWQVMQTAPTGSSPLASPTVLAAGISAAAPDDDGTGKEGTFTLDTADIPGHSEVEDGPPAVGQATLVESAVTPFTVVSLKEPKVVEPVAAGAAFDDRIQQLLELPAAGAPIYIQVTANPKGPAPGTSSNVVTVTLPTPIPPKPPESAKNGVTMKVDSLTLDPGRAPGADWAGCAEITLPNYYGRKPLDNKDPRNAAHQYYREGEGIYCYVPPAPPDPDDCFADVVPGAGEYICEAVELYNYIEDATVNFLKEAYGVASEIYNGAINGIVLLASKFNPVCIAAAEASKNVKETCEQLTAAVARAVISAVLASFGLPPQLPTLAELEAIANGELAKLAVALMKQAGIPCDSFKASPEVVSALEVTGDGVEGVDVAVVIADPCLALATALVKQATKQITKGVSSKTAAATRLQDFSHLTGFTMKPVRQSLPVPMQVRLTLSPVDPEVDATGLECAISLRPSAPALGAAPKPFLTHPNNYLRIKEDPPIDGKGSFSGGAAVSNYSVGSFVGSTPLSTTLKDLDVTMAVDATGPSGLGYVNDYNRCSGFKAEVTERVRPPD